MTESKIETVSEVVETKPVLTKKPVVRRKRKPKPKYPSPLKLDIGCGKVGWMQEPLDEWVHLDAIDHPHVEIVCEFGKIPLDDHSVDEIFIGDIVEHIPLWRYDEVLCEWSRIMKPGAIVKGRCPNIDRAMRDYAEGKENFQNAFNSIYGWGHKPTEVHYRGFTKSTLTDLLGAYGIKIKTFKDSPGPTTRPWWLVFSGIKVAEAEPIHYGMERFWDG